MASFCNLHCCCSSASYHWLTFPVVTKCWENQSSTPIFKVGTYVQPAWQISVACLINLSTTELPSCLNILPSGGILQVHGRLFSRWCCLPHNKSFSLHFLNCKALLITSLLQRTKNRLRLHLRHGNLLYASKGKLSDFVFGLLNSLQPRWHLLSRLVTTVTSFKLLQPWPWIATSALLSCLLRMNLV